MQNTTSSSLPTLELSVADNWPPRPKQVGEQLSGLLHGNPTVSGLELFFSHLDTPFGFITYHLKESQPGSGISQLSTLCSQLSKSDQLQQKNSDATTDAEFELTAYDSLHNILLQSPAFRKHLQALRWSVYANNQRSDTEHVARNLPFLKARCNTLLRELSHLSTLTSAELFLAPSMMPLSQLTMLTHLELRLFSWEQGDGTVESSGEHTKSWLTRGTARLDAVIAGIKAVPCLQSGTSRQSEKPPVGEAERNDLPAANAALEQLGSLVALRDLCVCFSCSKMGTFSSAGDAIPTLPPSWSALTALTKLELAHLAVPCGRQYARLPGLRELQLESCRLAPNRRRPDELALCIGDCAGVTSLHIERCSFRGSGSGAKLLSSLLFTHLQLQNLQHLEVDSTDDLQLLTAHLCRLKSLRTHHFHDSVSQFYYDIGR